MGSIWDAARAIRFFLAELLGVEAGAAFDAQLAAILAGGESESAAKQLRELLCAESATHEYLDFVVADPHGLPPQVAGAAAPPRRYTCPVGNPHADWFQVGDAPIPQCPEHHRPLRGVTRRRRVTLEGADSAVALPDHSGPGHESSPVASGSEPGLDETPAPPPSHVARRPVEGLQAVAEEKSARAAPPAAPSPGPVPAASPTPSPDVSRRLSVDVPQRAQPDRRISVQVSVLISQPGFTGPGTLAGLDVPPEGHTILVSVSSPGLDVEGDSVQELSIPGSGDSAPVLFRLRTRSVGLQEILVRAFDGGRFLGELRAEVSVENGAEMRHAEPLQADLGAVAGNSDSREVTLQVVRQGDAYQFQLLGEAFPAPTLVQLSADPVAATERLANELRNLAKAADSCDAKAARKRMKNLGAGLWAELVPQGIRQAYWEQADRIRALTIISELDTIPWELLYPVDDAQEDGFLVERCPVVRRVYGQSRAHRLQLGATAYVVPPGSPANAQEEVDSVAATLQGTSTPIVSRQGLDDLLDAGSTPWVHFACHNTFTPDSGSSIAFDDGAYTPEDLTLLAQRRTLRETNPLIFLNACRSAGEFTGLTQLTGWASQFLRAGAGAFVGTLWSVRSSTARRFAETFYSQLIGSEPQTLGVAAQRARAAIADEMGDPTWLAYTVYGDPFATVTRSTPGGAP